MKTPYGQGCRYYYEDFYRGRSLQECRLIQANPRSPAWRPELCKTCEMPGILAANACPNMALEGSIVKRWFGLVQRVQVYAVCTLKASEVSEPHIGCGECHKHHPGSAILGKNGFEIKREAPP